MTELNRLCIDQYSMYGSIDTNVGTREEQCVSVVFISCIMYVSLKRSKFRRYLSLGISFWGVFSCWIQFSTFWTSLWPYLSQIDPTVTPSFAGFVVSAFCLGAAVTSPLIGWWCNKIENIRLPIVVALIVNILGNTLFCFAEAFPSNRKYVILVARLISGMGSGAIGAFMSYAPDASYMHERNRVMSYQAASLSTSYFVGPILQAVFSPIGFPGTTIGQVRINMYTLPGYVCSLLSLITILLMIFVFKEYNVGVKRSAENNADAKLPQFDYVAAFACILSRFVIAFCVVYDVTIGTMMTMIMFNWSRSQAILYNGLINASGGVLDLLGNIFVECEQFSTKERNLMIFGLISYLLFYICSFSYPGLPELREVYFCPTDSPTMLSNGTSTNPNLWNITATSDHHCVAKAKLDRTVCSFNWCNHMTRIRLWSYVLAYFFMYLAFFTCFAPSVTLYSKVLGARRQRLMQGINMGMQNLANTISPIMVSSVFESSGPRLAWLIAMGILIATIVFMIVVYKRLVPFEEYMKDRKRIWQFDGISDVNVSSVTVPSLLATDQSH